MFVSSASGAGIVYAGPWGKALVTPSNVIVILSGCANMSGKPAVFHKATGVATWQGHAAAMSCKGSLGKGIASQSLEQYAVGITYPVRVPVGTNAVTFNVTWNISATANYTLSYKGKCPVATSTGGYNYVSCIAESIAQVINFAELVDLTTGVVSYPTFTSGTPAFAYSYVENSSYCLNATACYSYNYSAKTPWTSQNTSVSDVFSINTTVTSADHYAIFTYVGGDIVTEFQVYHGSASGAINMAAAGMGAKFVSINET